MEVKYSVIFSLARKFFLGRKPYIRGEVGKTSLGK